MAKKKAKKREVAPVGYRGHAKFIGDQSNMYCDKMIERDNSNKSLKKNKKYFVVVTCQDKFGCDVVVGKKEGSGNFIGLCHYNHREDMRDNWKFLDSKMKTSYPSGFKTMTIKEFKES